jgi:hypothetical protein
MALKIFRAVWFLSVLIVFADLLYVYSSLPEHVIVQDSVEQISVSREVFFYVALAAMVIVNVLVYLIAALFPKNLNFRAWFHGLIITINVFLVIAFSLVSLYNSAEKFDYGRIAFIIYGSVGLIVLWALTWPIFLVYEKFLVKSNA